MRYFILFILGIFTASSFATVRIDPYHTNVILEQGQSEHDAQVTGLENVIIKASGDKMASRNPVIKKALMNVSHYLTELGHEKNSESEITLKLGFNPKQIRELLIQAQLPYWPAQRTNILVWYIKDNGYQRSISWENVGGPDIDAIKHYAELIGLPVTIPVGDFDDITGVEVSDLWGGFLKPISQASRRYQPDAVLVIRAQEHRVRWTLYDQTPDEISQDTSSPLVGSTSENSTEAIKTFIDDISQYYAKKNGIVISAQSASESVKLEVHGIQNAMSFFALEDELKSLSSVASTDVTNVSGDVILYTVHILTSSRDFEQELMRLKHLIPLYESTGTLPEYTTSLSGDTYTNTAEKTAVLQKPLRRVLQYQWR